MGSSLENYNKGISSNFRPIHPRPPIKSHPFPAIKLRGFPLEGKKTPDGVLTINYPGDSSLS